MPDPVLELAERSRALSPEERARRLTCCSQHSMMRRRQRLQRYGTGRFSAESPPTKRAKSKLSILKMPSLKCFAWRREEDTTTCGCAS